MEKNYQPQKVEQQTSQLLSTPSSSQGKKSFYCLSMFPYPSGQLHMGHARVYTICDAISRYKRLNGYHVFNPMGWDAFGLPAENAAIKHKTDPATWTQQNIAQMKAQMCRLGLDFNWDAELQTCSPDYYKWQQWLFIQMHKKGLVYRKKSVVNWDPVDQTVLANEQVIDGCGWRSGAKVEQKKIEQWFIKITDYADELLCELEDLDWSHSVKVMQKNWIGQSHGTEVTFKVFESSHTVSVFTTRLDTLYGVSALMLAPDHPLIVERSKTERQLTQFMDECRKSAVDEATLETTEKKGMPTQLKAINPLSGETIPIWVANYVVGNYGTGAVMCVPGHDQRDFDFSQKYNLPVKQVIFSPSSKKTTLPYLDKGILRDSGLFSGMHSNDAIQSMLSELTQQNLGKSITRYRLRDWGVSRQRYWGCPIPMIHCEACGIVPEKEENLPVVLPPYMRNQNALHHPSFKKTICPQCGKNAHRESDTFDTFVDSSWYFLRYLCPQDKTTFLDENAKKNSPVDLYIGGIEHAILHLLYARFIHKTIRDLGFVESSEPFKRLLNQGMVLKDGHKMSKSKGNIVSPQDIIDEFGSDACRMFITFASPPQQSLEWSDQGLEGNFRFLRKLWVEAYADRLSRPEKFDTPAEAFMILKQITQDYNREQLNTVVSGIMKLFNLLQDKKHPSERFSLWKILLIALHPICPFITAQLWGELGFDGFIHHQKWPEIDEKVINSQSIRIAVQVNGKHKANIEIPPESDQESVLKIAQSHPKIEKILINGPFKRVIYVPNKILSLIQ